MIGTLPDRNDFSLSSQDRALTPREGARIQSFPDWFQFEGDKENVTTQIGNAVPPLLAMALEKNKRHAERLGIREWELMITME